MSTLPVSLVRGVSRGLLGPLFLVLGFAPPTHAGAPTVVGNDFAINTITAGDQKLPAVVATPTGFVVVWETSDDGDSSGIRGRRFDADGMPLGTELLINTYTTGTQSHPSVAVDLLGKVGEAGDFLVTWQSSTFDGSGSSEIVARHYTASGSPSAGEFQVNSTIVGEQSYPAVANNGLVFLVGWQSAGQDGSGEGIFARSATDMGVSGGEFPINTFTTGDQRHPSITFDGINFVMAWQSEETAGSGVHDIRGVSLGSPPDSVLNSTTMGDQVRPSLTSDATGAGSWVAVWQSQESAAEGPPVYDIKGRSFGAAEGGGVEFGINVATSGDQVFPTAVQDSSGLLAVAWNDRAPPTALESGKRPAEGAPVYRGRVLDTLPARTTGPFEGGSDEFTIANSLFDGRAVLTFADLADGADFVVAWEEDRPVEGVMTQIDLRARRYATPEPCGLFCDGFGSGDTTAWSSSVGLR